MDRHDQRGQLFQTSSSVSTHPNQSWQNHGWEQSKSSWDQTDYHASWCQVSCVLIRSPFLVIVVLVSPPEQMAKRSQPFTDEALKYTGASSKSKPEGEKSCRAGCDIKVSSPLIIAQEKTQSDVTGQVNPSQASGNRLHVPGPTSHRTSLCLRAGLLSGSVPLRDRGPCTVIGPSNDVRFCATLRVCRQPWRDGLFEGRSRSSVE